MTPQEFLTSKKIDVNEAVRTADGNLFTVCELLMEFADKKDNEELQRQNSNLS